MKVMIIGAGIGGLTTAVMLRQAGVAVRVYEASDALRESGAALTLWPNARHALAQLGLIDAVVGAPLDSDTGIFNASGSVLSRMRSGVMQKRYGCTPLVVDRGALLQTLAEAAGDVIDYGRRLRVYKQNNHAITAHFEDGTFDTGNLLVGADGIYSTVRRQMHPRSTPIYRGYAAWRGVTDFPHADAGGMWGEFWGRGRRFGLLPLDGERVYWFAVENRDPDSPPHDHHAHLKNAFGDWATPLPDVIAATPTDALLYNDIEDIEPLSRWHDGLCVLLGDAAHAMTPNLGQGACQAIEDAVILGRTLTTEADLPAALASYEAARVTHTRKVLLRAREMGRVGQLENAVAVGARDAGMRLTPEAVTLRTLDGIIGNMI